MRDVRDLVDRLRKNDAKAQVITASAPPFSIQGEAADEIERLRALLRQSESDQRDAERYRFLRDSPNAYPLFFIAQRDPNNIVVQFQGELADLNIDEMLRSMKVQR